MHTAHIYKEKFDHIKISFINMILTSYTDKPRLYKQPNEFINYILKYKYRKLLMGCEF